MVVQCESKILSRTLRDLSTSLVMLNSYPHDGIFNPRLTTIKDYYILACLMGISMWLTGIRKCCPTRYCKNSDTQKFCGNHPKIWRKWLYFRVMHPKDAERIVNSVDPDQTATQGAVWSGSALFAKIYLSENLGSLQYPKRWLPWSTLLSLCLIFRSVLTSLYELPHDKTNKMAYVPSEDSDQPGHLPSLIRVFTVRSMGTHRNVQAPFTILSWKCISNLPKIFKLFN